MREKERAISELHRRNKALASPDVLHFPLIGVLGTGSHVTVKSPGEFKFKFS
jgi:hypothetical protein